MTVAHFDLIVIGSGSGNSVLTHEMADWKIAIVEESTFGGTCLNVGCIPTKMYVYAADVASSIRHAQRYGIDGHIDQVRWTDIRDRIFARIDPISENGRRHRQASGHTTLFEAHAEFTGPNSLRLSTGETITSDRIVIAAGSRAVVPEVIRAAGVPFHTSDTIMRIATRPERLIIVGGGYVAAEFAHIFSALGSRVTMLVRGPRLLRHADGDISRRFTELARQKWDVHLDAQIAAVARPVHGAAGSRVGSGAAIDPGQIRVALADAVVIDGDAVLVATGRVPNSDRLALPAAGVEIDDHGRIVVDKYQRTTAAGIWALGDVSSADQLKHVANQDARVVAHNLTHPDSLTISNHDAIPSAVFTEPQLASVGLTEEQARARGLDYVSAEQRYGDTAYGWAMEDTSSVAKLLCERSTGRLLGAHLMGPQASVLIQPLIQAIVFDQRIAELARAQYWIHPALSEVVENALLALVRARTLAPAPVVAPGTIRP